MHMQHTFWHAIGKSMHFETVFGYSNMYGFVVQQNIISSIFSRNVWLRTVKSKVMFGRYKTQLLEQGYSYLEFSLINQLYLSNFNKLTFMSSMHKYMESKS